MKQYERVQVNHHKDIAKTIEEWQKKGWQLHSYEAAGSTTAISHYLLFEKDEWAEFFPSLAEESARYLLLVKSEHL